MALTITFANGRQLPYLSALETEGYYSGASRRTLTCQLAADATGLDALNLLLSDEANTETITLANTQDGSTSLHSGYVIKAELAVKPVPVAAETPDAPAQSEERIVFTLARRTYIEQQLARLGL